MRKETGFWLVIAGGAVALFYAVGLEHERGWDLELHSGDEPTPHYQSFLVQYSFFGALAALALTRVLLSVSKGREEKLLRLFRTGGERRFLVAAGAAACGIALLVHQFCLQGAALTADEGAYRYAADLLAHGRLSNASHPAAAFFERPFMVNNGRYYAQYFLGWPLLLAPGVLLGLPWLVNPMLLAVSVPGIYWTVKRLCDQDTARVAVLLTLASPMVVLGAATQMSHTSCAAAGIWASWCALRTRDSDAPNWVFSAFAALFVLGFFIRPLSMLALALPLLVVVLWNARRSPSRILAVGIPLVVGAALFLGVNQLQHGSPFMTGYEAYRQHFVATEGVFSGLSMNRSIAVPNVYVSIGQDQLANLGVALFRLNYAWLGLPIPVFFLIFARWEGETRLFFAMLLTYFGTLQFTKAGVDTFGPVHFFEGFWPLLVLTVLGVRALQDRLRAISSQPLVYTGLAALLLVSGVIYWPVRLAKVHEVSSAILRPAEALRRAGVRENAVVFYDYPWAPLCPWTKHFNRAAPLNAVDWEGPVVIAGNLGNKANTRFLARYYPGREVYFLRHGEKVACELEVLRER